MAHGPSTSQAQVALVKVVATFQTHHRDLTGETGRFDPRNWTNGYQKLRIWNMYFLSNVVQFEKFKFQECS